MCVWVGIECRVEVGTGKSPTSATWSRKAPDIVTGVAVFIVSISIIIIIIINISVSVKILVVFGYSARMEPIMSWRESSSARALCGYILASVHGSVYVQLPTLAR